MAFTGTPTITSLGANIAKITTVTLASGASGTIGANGDTGADIQLPSTQPAITTSFIVVANQEAAGAVSPLAVVTGGSPVRTTIINTDGANATGSLCIFLMRPHSLIS